MRVNGLILTGGRSRRFGGVHKPGVLVDGTPVLSRVHEAVSAVPAHGVWVAGPLDGLGPKQRRGVHHVLERPRFGGPLAGIAAAVADMPPDPEAVVLILAGDVPYTSVDDLVCLASASAVSGKPAGCIDQHNRFQQLFAAWPDSLLRERIQAIGDPANQRVRLLWDGIDPVLVDVSAASTDDFDTPDDLRRIEERAGHPDERGARDE